VFFSNHSEEDSGWLFTGKEKGSFVAMSVLQVMCVCLFFSFANVLSTVAQKVSQCLWVFM
jgi:hypothetical protein